jgi:hypothetical protein
MFDKPSFDSSVVDVIPPAAGRTAARTGCTGSEFRTAEGLVATTTGTLGLGAAIVGGGVLTNSASAWRIAHGQPDIFFLLQTAGSTVGAEVVVVSS